MDHAPVDATAADPTKLNASAPRYPPVALQSRIGGTVVLGLSLDASGTVLAVEVVKSSGHASLDASAVAEAYWWTFTPARQDGTPVPIRIRVPVSFEPQPN